MMEIEFLSKKGTWRDVADAARTTIHREPGELEPSDNWKMRMLLAEHSPIRQLIYKWKWINIPYWVSVHFVRHKIGIEHWVSTQRTDRTGINRTLLSQNSPVIHECEANAQALINISKKRLCHQASPETREAWQLVKDEIQKAEPTLAKCMVPECVYRNGVCREFYCCGFVHSDKFIKELKEYEYKSINEQKYKN
jgi:hypothetical protein